MVKNSTRTLATLAAFCTFGPQIMAKAKKCYTRFKITQTIYLFIVYTSKNDCFFVKYKCSVSKMVMGRSSAWTLIVLYLVHTAKFYTLLDM